ncbi:MAG: epimerase [Proteobacteria bacterium]|nr:epimerase [Pseudomonadota bacterium]
MSPTRRQFLHHSVATGALASLGLTACSSPRAPNAPSGGTGASSPPGTQSTAPASTPAPQSTPVSRSKRILILGGTGFLGPALIEATLARGHSLTLFNSGRTEARRKAAGRPSVVPDSVELLVGNRDPDKTADDRRLAGDPEADKKRDPNSPKGLAQLEGKSWDGVIDTSAFFPRMVRASAGLLAPNVGQYVFISSISVYKNTDRPGLDESGELHGLDDPTTEDFGPNFENYGGGKALCEAAAEATMPGRTTNIRPGFIVGPRDTSRRWLYWPWRTAQGGEMLAPGTPEDPVQIIDVRDLAEWIVHCIEAGVVGAFNATGPDEELSMRAMLEGCRRGAGADTKVTWIEPEFLAEHKVRVPIWVPPTGETAGFHRVSVQRAVQNGLRFRSVEDTARDTLKWHASLPEKLQKLILPPEPTPAREAEVLKLWRERHG